MPASRVAPVGTQLIDALQDLLTAHVVRTVIADPSEHDAAGAIRLFEDALGPSQSLSGVIARFNLGDV